ncbi:MAG: hypothetical protein EXR81_04860 [Gammaproteobacteria bacterium]|nr:hypothetical protein [Gammaproteobacteria bacterium]
MKRLLIFCTLLITTYSFAEPRITYMDLALNYGSLQTPNTDYSPNSYQKAKSHDVGGLGFGINVGYLFDSYQFSIAPEWRLGVEAGYHQFADNTYTYGSSFRSSSDNDIKYSSYALSFLGVLRYQDDNHWLAFFKSGVARVTQSLKTTSSSSNDTPSKAGFNPQFILGGGYQLTRSINVDASYNYIMGKQPNVGNNNTIAPVSYLAFSLGYSF